MVTAPQLLGTPVSLAIHMAELADIAPEHHLGLGRRERIPDDKLRSRGAQESRIKAAGVDIGAWCHTVFESQWWKLVQSELSRDPPHVCASRQPL